MQGTIAPDAWLGGFLTKVSQLEESQQRDLCRIISLGSEEDYTNV